MNFYRRNLPHWQPQEAEYFITFRLEGSLPKKVVEQLTKKRKLLQNAIKRDELKPEEVSKQEQIIQRKIFQKYEYLLDKEETGPTWLSNETVAKIVTEALHHRNQNQYDLYAYCIMSNHVHTVFKLLKTKETLNSNRPVTDLLQKLKSYTAVHANKMLGRTGQFWHHESYDHVIRNSDELERIVTYTLNNPVKASLITKWEDWPHSYCKPEFLSSFSNK